MRTFTPDKDQQAVIEFYGGKALVLAAPGCGKTEILSHRVLKARTDYEVPYSEMLCLTFTNRASREMRDRIRQTLHDNPGDLFIGNLHRFCIRFLYDHQLVPIDTSIIDDTDQGELIQELAANHGLGTLKGWEVSAVLGNACSIREENGNIPFKAHSDKGSFGFAETLAMEYLKFLRSNRLLDYDDILYYTYIALAKPKLRDSLDHTYYSWIQIDEIQDLNPLQLAIIELLATPDATIVYLGDERQSIYSFLGAKRESLERIQKQCGSNIFYLSRNYRAPVYLLDMLNDYAADILQMDVRRLPSSTNITDEDNALQCVDCFDTKDQQGVVGALVQRITDKAPEESIGILVRTNKDADEISSVLSQLNIRHLAITNRDIFKSLSFKNLLSHFSVVNLDTAYTDWSRIMFQTKVLPKLSQARQCVRKMRNIGVTPKDLLEYDSSTYILEYIKSVNKREIVVFDTETTGIDVFNDDIIQIAACKMKDGHIIEGTNLDIMIRTTKSLPEKLANGMPNPMVEEYKRRAAIKPGEPGCLMEPYEAFKYFIKYIEGAELLGHNVNFDVRILKNNIARRCPELEYQLPMFWDTLAIARRLDPNLRRHNLQTLLDIYHLDGTNSHNAADDVYATANLATALYEKSLERQGDHRAFVSLEITDAIRNRLREKYGPLFYHTAILLDKTDAQVSFTEELSYIHSEMVSKNYIEPIERFDLMGKLFDKVVIDSDKEPYFAQQLINHLHELRTFNEADLYQNGIIEENVHVMTIHKAKGLQFDNVIIPDVSKDVFPRSTSRKPEEEARLLYVGLSRAKRRIILTFVGKISPFISTHPHIEEHFSYMSFREKERLLGRRRGMLSDKNE